MLWSDFNSLPCIAKIPEFEAQHVGLEMVLSVDLLKLFFFDDGVDGDNRKSRKLLLKWNVFTHEVICRYKFLFRGVQFKCGEESIS